MKQQQKQSRLLRPPPHLQGVVGLRQRLGCTATRGQELERLQISVKKWQKQPKAEWKFSAASSTQTCVQFLGPGMQNLKRRNTKQRLKMRVPNARPCKDLKRACAAAGFSSAAAKMPRGRSTSGSLLPFKASADDHDDDDEAAAAPEVFLPFNLGLVEEVAAAAAASPSPSSLEVASMVTSRSATSFTTVSSCEWLALSFSNSA